MRIAVLSDIHGNFLALKAVLRDLSQRQVDTVVNLGDSLSGPLQPAETAEFLMTQPWVQLAGNHERQLLEFAPDRAGFSDRYAHSRLSSEAFAWMAKLLPTQLLNKDVFLCHGTPQSDSDYFLDSVDAPQVRAATPDEVEARLGSVSTSVVLCGHTHIPRVVRSRSGQLLVNPGSVGLQAYEDDNPAYHAVENHSPNARYAIVEKRDEAWSAQLLEVPYDHASAADMARQRGAATWAMALLSGHIQAAASPLQQTINGD